MPARRFFAMLEQARRMKAEARIDDCYIAQIPNGGAKYFESMRDSFKAQIPGHNARIMEDLERAQLQGAEAKNAMMGMFR